MSGLFCGTSFVIVKACFGKKPSYRLHFNFRPNLSPVQRLHGETGGTQGKDPQKGVSDPKPTGSGLRRRQLHLWARRYTGIAELTQELLRLFIRKIVVHEKSVKWSKHAPQTVEIHYTDIGYVGNVNDTQICQENTADVPETERPRQAP